MGGFWGADPDGESAERQGPVYYPDNNSGSSSGSSGSSCPMAIPKVLWTTVKVSFNYIFRGIKPDYVT